MEGDQGYPPADAPADPGYERAMQRLEAALDLALSGGAEHNVDSISKVRLYLDAARAEIGRIRASDAGPDVALAWTLAKRIAADPRLSLSSQKPRGELTLKTPQRLKASRILPFFGERE